MDSDPSTDKPDALEDLGTRQLPVSHEEYEEMDEEVEIAEDQCGGTDPDALHAAGHIQTVEKEMVTGQESMETGHSTDAGFFGLCGTKAEDAPQEPSLPTVSQQSDVYDMTSKYRGHALVINNERFSYKLNQQGLGNRTGSSVDETNIRRCLHNLDFGVTVYTDLTASSMKSVCSKMAAADHSECDCFVFVILSHGEEGIVYGTDKTVEIKELTDYFRGDVCPTLIGKPKVFFIQACRGYQTDPGVPINVLDAKGQAFEDIDRNIIKLPLEADFLYAYSTVPGFYSWRNGMNGSWFIQALSEVLSEHGRKLEIRKILTLVNRKVAQNFQSMNPDNPGFHQMKQVPCISSMLTKDLVFSTSKRRRVL